MRNSTVPIVSHTLIFYETNPNTSGKQGWRVMATWLAVSIQPIQVKLSVSTWECSSITWLAALVTRISVLYLMVRYAIRKGSSSQTRFIRKWSRVWRLSNRSSFLCNAIRATSALCHSPYFNEPADPLILWNILHKDCLSEDFLFRARAISTNLQLDEDILNSALLDIEHQLKMQRKSLTDFWECQFPHIHEVHMINLESLRMNWVLMLLNKRSHGRRIRGGHSTAPHFLERNSVILVCSSRALFSDIVVIQLYTVEKQFQKVGSGTMAPPNSTPMASMSD